MTGPQLYCSRAKPNEMPKRPYVSLNDINEDKQRETSSIGNLRSSNLTLKFETNVLLKRNSMLMTVVILNVLVTVVSIAVAVLTGVHMHKELSDSQRNVQVLNEHVVFLRGQYDNLLQQLQSVRMYENFDADNRASENPQFLAGANIFPSQTQPVDILKISRNKMLQAFEETSTLEDKPSRDAAVVVRVYKTKEPPVDEPLSSKTRIVDGDASQSGTLSTLRRTKRSEWRGKQSQRKPSKGGRGKQRRRGKFSGPAVAHFKGGQPEAYIRDGGLVAPWYLDEAASGSYALSSFQLKQGKAAVEVSESGLYYVYSQIHYLTSEVTNSYSLNLRHGSQSNSSVLSYCCASSGGGNLNEVSCFTSIVRYLSATDRIFIQQRDMNRRIILRDGYSYLGIVRLNK